MRRCWGLSRRWVGAGWFEPAMNDGGTLYLALFVSRSAGPREERDADRELRRGVRAGEGVGSGVVRGAGGGRKSATGRNRVGTAQFSSRGFCNRATSTASREWPRCASRAAAPLVVRRERAKLHELQRATSDWNDDGETMPSCEKHIVRDRAMSDVR